ncbi:MAG: DUF2877 domain-containing protein [Chloroflexi bacterium]|nr:DUF2877 domain-containing protein [Chloroflexota bacterium]
MTHSEIEADGVRPGVAEALAHCRAQGGRVAGHYRHVLIVQSGPRLLAVQDRTAACSPFSLVLAQPQRTWPAAGTAVSADARLLRIGEMSVRLPDGPAMSAPTAGEPETMTEDPAATSRRGGASKSGPHAWAESILAPHVAASAFGGAGQSGVQRLVRERGAAALGELTRADSWNTLRAAAERLCGLGGGATPSGDDALVGFLGAWLRLAPPAERRPARALAAWLAALAPERTSRLAAEFYYHLARERLSEPVDQVLSALGSGEPGAVEIAAARLARYGASSGHDTLAGVDAYLRRPSRP